MIMLGTGIVLTLFWNLPLFYPVKLFAVLIHEMWHGLASLAVGAHLEKVILYGDESGETLVSELKEHWQFIISVSAGYQGTLITGSILLNRSLLGRGEKFTLGVFAGLLLYMSLLFTDPGSPAFLTGLIASIFFFSMLLFETRVTGLVMLLTGTLLVWYSFFDTLDFTTKVTRTDAGILASYLVNRGVVSGDSGSIETMAGLISFVWTGMLIGMLYLLMKPVWVASPPVFVDGSQDPTPEMDQEFSPEFDPELDGILQGLVDGTDNPAGDPAAAPAPPPPVGPDELQELLQLQALVREFKSGKDSPDQEPGPPGPG